ncbi:MAG: EamA family transporter [Candidatus Dadabacteria bacterium]|nr:EamA family transporter [Candidatus Dadabacteria bacterium]NIQ15312.1 EamA family transporter [Candidatus Dadabacteria bacterium]
MSLIAFAANSVICRLALDEKTIDASSYTSFRLLSGAIVLLLILHSNKKTVSTDAKGSWISTLMLFLYAASFSFAYITLDTGTGALILFGAVQISMILSSLLSGNRLHLTEWFGVSIAFFGFVYLILPGVKTPTLTGFILMTIAGVSWGIYTLRGKNSINPLADTTYNFTRSIPLVLILLLFTLKISHLSLYGVILSILSGGIASGIGYTIWYLALGGLSATQAAVVQLFVPVLAAIGGVIFVSEQITLRLSISALFILGGIFLVILGRYYFVTLKSN